MGWENRGGKRYYYRKVRKGQRVVSEYYGADYLALFAEVQDETRHTQRLNERLAILEQRKQFDELRNIHSQIEGIEELIRSIYHGSLLASGYHAHARQWRKKRCQNP